MCVRRKNLRGLTLIAAFLLPAGVLWLVFMSLGFAPAGDKAVLIMDMHEQYAPFFASLRALLSGDASLFFSFQKQMGTGFVGLFAYYIASPLNLFVLLFPARQLPLALTLLTCLKTGLCGLSMQWYLLRARRLPAIPALILGCGYALMSYNVVYGMCLMWLDAVALTPLVLWGVEKLAAGKRPVHLLLCLVALFWCDYYIGYMVGLFALLYLGYLLISRQSALSPFKAVSRLTGTAAAAIGLLAFYLLPVGMDLLTGKLDSLSWQPASWYYFPPWEMLQKVLPGNYTSITYYGLPLLYGGTLPLIGAVWFFLRRRIPWQKRAAVGGLLVLLAASFVLCGLDYVWHGFRFPNWFPTRYAFLWVFVLIVAAAGFIQTLPIPRWRDGYTRPLYYLLALLLLSLQLAELGINARVQVQGLDGQFAYRSTAAYEEAYDETAPLATRLQKQDEGFYRVEKTYRYSRNDALLYGYNGITHYSSTYHAAVNRLFGAMGFVYRRSWDTFYSSTPVTDALFGVKYVLSKTDIPAYSAVAGNRTVTAYENPYVLPVALAADAGLVDWTLPETDDPFAAQESLLSALCGRETAVWKRPAVEEYNDAHLTIFTLTMPHSGPLYAALPAGSQTGASRLYVNGAYWGDCLSANSPNLLALGRFSIGGTVSVVLEKHESAQLAGSWFAVLDETALERETDLLQQGGLQLAQVQGATLTGRITVAEDQVVYLSLPYSDGFTVRADGKPVETFAISDSLLGARLPAGTVDLTVTYTAPGFTAGGILSLLTAGGLAILAIWSIKRRRSAS